MPGLFFCPNVNNVLSFALPQLSMYGTPMNDQMQSEIRESIAKNLPNAVGEELQKLLAQGKLDAEVLKKTRGLLEQAQDEIAMKAAKIVNLQAELQRAGDLDKREQVVTERERNALVTELRTQLASAEANTTFARDVALGLVRNVEYRERTAHTSTVPVPFTNPSSGGMGGGTYVVPHSTTVSDDITREAK